MRMNFKTPFAEKEDARALGSEEELLVHPECCRPDAVRAPDHCDELATGDMVQRAQLVGGFIEMPAHLEEHPFVGPGRFHLADEEVVGLVRAAGGSPASPRSPAPWAVHIQGR